MNFARTGLYPLLRPIRCEIYMLSSCISTPMAWAILHTTWSVGILTKLGIPWNSKEELHTSDVGA